MKILKARRQALIRELMATIKPYVRSKEEIRCIYRKAIKELSFSISYEGEDFIRSLTISQKRHIGIEIIDRKLWGLKYRDVIINEDILRNPDERQYGYLFTTPHLEECIYLFEKILDSMLKIAAFESKLKRLSEEIIKTTRKIKILEEKKLPQLKSQIRYITQYLEEREREDYYRLKIFKG
jgi:V/A-type H+-transporting ATPase subunit D